MDYVYHSNAQSPTYGTQNYSIRGWGLFQCPFVSIDRVRSWPCSLVIQYCILGMRQFAYEILINHSSHLQRRDSILLSATTTWCREGDDPWNMPRTGTGDINPYILHLRRQLTSNQLLSHRAGSRGSLSLISFWSIWNPWFRAPRSCWPTESLQRCSQHYTENCGWKKRLPRPLLVPIGYMIQKREIKTCVCYTHCVCVCVCVCKLVMVVSAKLRKFIRWRNVTKNTTND